MAKKNILHFIHSLGRGGAETMLVRAIRELPEYNNIVVTLFDDDRLGSELQCDKYICMELQSLKQLPLAAIKLRRIINDNKVHMVHTHLIWPTVVARMSVPKIIPLLTTIHTSIDTAPDYKKWYIRGMDKFTYNFRKNIIIGVSKTALNGYFSFLGVKPFRSYVLYTFVELERFKLQERYRTTVTGDESKTVFEVISTGSLREAKNFPLLIEALSILKNENIVLHIYGGGPLKETLQKMIDTSGAKVILKGEIDNMQDVLPRYDAYVMASKYEGFSLAVLEAMAVKLPMLMSNIPSFREQLEDTALFFELGDSEEIGRKLLWMKNNRYETHLMSERSFRRVTENFTLQHHMNKLRQIYAETLSEQ